MIEDSLKDRILILDGAMGTMLRSGGPHGQEDSTDVLCLTAPQAVASVHRRYLEAGADIIETNTCCANRLSLRAFGCGNPTAEINRAGAAIARSEADRQTALTPDRPRYVAGAVGPAAPALLSGLSLTAQRSLHAELHTAYVEQMTALAEGGVDILLIETSFDLTDTLTALRAACEAADRADREIGIMVAATLAEHTGRMPSGHDVTELIEAATFARPLAIGLNCSSGPVSLLPALRRLAAASPYPIIAYPNAGLPGPDGNYPCTPRLFAGEMLKMADEGLLNIAGGCCGTTPEHIAMLAAGMQSRIRRPAFNHKSKAHIIWKQENTKYTK